MPKKSRRKAKAGRSTANGAIRAASIDKDTGAAPTLPSGIECRTPEVVSECAQIPILPTAKVTADGLSKEDSEQKGNDFIRSLLGSGLRVSVNPAKQSGGQIGSFYISGSGSTAPKISDDVMAKVAAVISEGKLKKWPISLIEMRATDALDSALVAVSDTASAFPNQDEVFMQPDGRLAAKITDAGDVEIYLPQGFDRRGLIYQPFYKKIAEVAVEGKRRGKPKAQMEKLEKRANGILLSTF